MRGQPWLKLASSIDLQHAGDEPFDRVATHKREERVVSEGCIRPVYGAKVVWTKLVHACHAVQTLALLAECRGDRRAAALENVHEARADRMAQSHLLANEHLVGEESRLDGCVEEGACTASTARVPLLTP